MTPKPAVVAPPRCGNRRSGGGRRARFFFLAVAWTGAAGLAAGADTWTEVVSPSFTVVSNAGEGKAKRAARELEQVRGAYQKIWPSAHIAQGRPMIVLALKDRETLERWVPGHYEVKGGIDLASTSASGADRTYLLLRTDYRPNDPDVAPAYNLYRAYVRLLLRGSFERGLPVWLTNGLGQVLGNTFVKDKEILVGRPVPRQFRRFNRGGRLPLQAILDARSKSPLLEKQDQRDLFDAQSAVLVHYMMFADKGSHYAELRRFLQLWLAGAAHDQAFAEAFGSLDELEGNLQAYPTRPTLGYARFQTGAEDEGGHLTSRTLPPAEVAGLQAAVHVAMGRPVEAQAAIREARAADPHSPVSYDAEGLLADLDRDEARARQAYAQAVELGSTNAHSHYRAAQLTWKPEADEATLAEVRRRLERALELNDSFADAYSFLAEVLVDQDDGEGALVRARRAVELEPGEAYHRVALARALHHVGRDDEAAKSAELGLQLADTQADRSNAERFLLYLKDAVRYAQERARHETLQENTKACERGDSAACAVILPELERTCADKQAEVCLYLGWLYSQGTGLAKDAAKAAKYLELACAAGNRQACVEHAWKLINGEGLAQDEAGGVAALQSLCDEDFYAACTRLAVAEAGKGSAAALSRAKALLTRACEGGEQDACSMASQLE